MSPDFISFAVAAAGEALGDAGLLLVPPGAAPGVGALTAAYDTARFGVTMGTGIGGIEEIGSTAAGLLPPLLASPSSSPTSFPPLPDAGLRRVSPFFVPRVLVNMAAGNVSIRFGLRGPNHAASTACASGAHAIGDAFRLIKHGDADAMVAGGTESCIAPISLAGFSRAKALASRNNAAPGEASRPFDAGRDGFILGEGAGVLVLEELESARRRGARIYAEVRGYGLSGDAHHVTAPAESGDGAYRCMLAALQEGGLRPADVGYVNAHATGTPLGDGIEAAAIGRLFAAEGDGGEAGGAAGAQPLPQEEQEQQRVVVPRRRPLVSSTKGAVGHLLGAAGSVEAVFTALVVHTGDVPGTRTLANPDPALPTGTCDFPTDAVRGAGVRAALSNSFGFGGTNCSLLFAEAPKA
jgi:3-oxoacyl-[acyl-carrier-protein] synthase II